MKSSLEIFDLSAVEQFEQDDTYRQNALVLGNVLSDMGGTDEVVTQIKKRFSL